MDTQQEYKNSSSANALFHFTSKENLLGILENNFYPRYCFIEESDERESSIAVPMVCFCDIPLSQIKNHIEDYGKYGIGLSKEWAIENEITPVLYYHKKSPTKFKLKELSRLYEDNPEDAFSDLIYYRNSYWKLYEGFMNRNGENKKRIFYNEREWRYVPKLKILGKSKIPIYLSREKINDEKIKLSSNKKLEKNCMLYFEPKDIKYLIVEKDEDIFEFRRHIEPAKGGKYSYEEITLLLSKFICTQDLIEDF